MNTFPSAATKRKFKKRKHDEDTRIIEEQYQQYKDIDFLLEKWCWDGILAESAIFLEEQVKDMSDEALIAFTFEALGLPIDPQTSIKRNSNGFAFINFHFLAGD